MKMNNYIKFLYIFMAIFGAWLSASMIVNTSDILYSGGSVQIIIGLSVIAFMGVLMAYYFLNKYIDLIGDKNV